MEESCESATSSGDFTNAEDEEDLEARSEVLQLETEWNLGAGAVDSESGGTLEDDYESFAGVLPNLKPAGCDGEEDPQSLVDAFYGELKKKGAPGTWTEAES